MAPLIAPCLPPLFNFLGYPPTFRGVYLSFGVTIPSVKHDPLNEGVLDSVKKNLAKISSKTGLLHSSVLFIEKPTYYG